MKTLRFTWLGSIIVVLLAAPVGGAAAQTDESPSDSGAVASGADYADMVMEAWDTYDVEAIEAVYAPDVVMIIDQATLAEDRDELAVVIKQALGMGNSYRQVGDVVVHEAPAGDLYLGTIVEVVGRGHPKGVPVVGFYRVRDGQVIRHVFMDAEHY